MSTILPLFWHLSSTKSGDRLDAAAKLISSLEQLQEQFSPPPRDSEKLSPEEELLRFNAPDVAYSIKRLIRGLASPRESSRLGFVVPLTEVCFDLFPDFRKRLHNSLASKPNSEFEYTSGYGSYFRCLSNARLDDWPGRTRHAFREIVWPHFSYSVWLAVSKWGITTQSE